MLKDKLVSLRVEVMVSTEKWSVASGDTVQGHNAFPLGLG